MPSRGAPALLYPALESVAVEELPAFFTPHPWNDEEGPHRGLPIWRGREGWSGPRSELGVEERHLSLLYAEVLWSILGRDAIAAADALLDELRLEGPLDRCRPQRRRVPGLGLRTSAVAAF